MADRKSNVLPSPPESGLDPHLALFKTKRLFRVHAVKYNAKSFNPGGKGTSMGRFHPIFDKSNNPIPTLYVSDQINGALSETVFRDTISGDTVYEDKLKDTYLSRIEFKKDLQLVDLTGIYIRRLKITRLQLIESEEDEYKVTARWAEALHHACPKAHGIKWVSRKFDTAKSILLFGDRVKPSQLTDLNKSELLEKGNGLQHVRKAAMQANITVATG